MSFSLPAVLSITGSDSTADAGIGADIRTISALGGRALVAITSVMLNFEHSELPAYDMPPHLVSEQIRVAVQECRPKAVKVGLVRDPQTIALLPGHLASLGNRVMVPSIVDSYGRCILSPEAMHAWMEHLLPLASLLILRVSEAEIMLGCSISTDSDMLQAASELRARGAKAVLMRGGKMNEGYLTALLMHEDGHRFFSSRNTIGWQRHGVAGALSSAIATRYAYGDTTEQAVANAHSYIHSRVVYAVSPSEGTYALRPGDVYNNFLSLLAGYYNKAHDVAFYASHLCVSPRYLQSITDKVVGRSPKQIISDYLMQEARSMLEATRLTVQEVSQHLGFSSQAQFARFFMKEQGVSPSSYRIGQQGPKDSGEK